MEEVELVSVKTTGENGVLSLDEASDVDSESDLIGRSCETDKGGGFSVKVKSLLKSKKTAEDRDTHGGGLKRELTYISGVAYIIGSTIGSGIFITPSTILCRTGSFGLSMVMWVIGGVIAIAGSFCYIELALLIRQSGSDFSYIKETYSFNKRNKVVEVLGSLLAFLFVWGTVFVIRTSSLAIITLACAEYFIKPLFIECEDIPTNAVKLLSISVLIILVMINCYSLKLASKVMTVLTATKILAVVFIALVGIIFMIMRGPSENLKQPFDTAPGLEPDVSSVTLSLYGVLWAYSGWDSMGYAVEETKNAKRNVPLILLTAIPIVTVCYLLVNLSFFAILSPDQILNAQAVGVPFGKYTIGIGGVVMVLLFVSFATFGAANGSLFVGSRLIHVASREGELPDVLSGLHVTAKTPVPAIIFQVSLTILMVSIGTIDQLIDGFTFASLFFYILSISAVIILRITRRKEPRLFKGWFIVPIAVLLVCFFVFLLIAPLLSGPPPLFALGFFLLGVPVYFFLVMTSPWKIRPKFMDKIGESVSGIVNKVLNTQSGRHLQEPRSTTGSS